MESFEICRVCMEEVKHVWSLFERCDKVPFDVTPASLITECAEVTIEPNDGLPDLVCDSCLESMVEAYTIRHKCISSDRRLRKILLRNHAIILRQEVKVLNKSIDRLEEIGHESDSCEGKTMVQYSMDEQESDGSSVDAYSEILQTNIVASHKAIKGKFSPAYLDEEYLIEYCKEQQDDRGNSDQQIAMDDTSDHKSEQVTVVESVSLPENHDGRNTNEEEKKFICEICMKRFTTKGNMKAHTLLHTHHKPFRCELCEATFFKKHNYNLHRMRHVGERTHPCPVCEKSFVCAVNLKNHMHIHSIVKPFQCAYCDKEFSYRTDKARHETTHTGEYPYGCEKCQRKFSRNTSLVKHLVKCKGPKETHPAQKRTRKAVQTEQ